MPRDRSRRIHWWIAAALLALFVTVAGLASSAAPGLDSGPSTLQPAGTALDSAGAGSAEHSASELYDSGWWSIEMATDGFVLVHHR